MGVAAACDRLRLRRAGPVQSSPVDVSSRRADESRALVTFPLRQ